MKDLRKNRGHVLVKLLIALISISVISTALLNVHLKAGQQVYYEDLSSLMSMQARNAFGRLNYQLRLAGYGNTTNKEPIQIQKASESDTLIIHHNDIEVKFYVDNTQENGVLYESLDGSPKKLIEGARALVINKSAYNAMTIELTLGHKQADSEEGIVSRSYSTTVKLDNY